MRWRPLPERKFSTSNPADEVVSVQAEQAEKDLEEILCEIISEGDMLVAESEVFRGKVHDNPHHCQWEESEEVEGYEKIELLDEDVELITAHYDYALSLIPFGFDYEEREGVIWKCELSHSDGVFTITAEVQ